jgi:hypothetical protein
MVFVIINLKKDLLRNLKVFLLKMKLKFLLMELL